MPEERQGPLARYSVDMTAARHKAILTPALNYGEFVKRAIPILCRKTRRNPLLISASQAKRVAVVEEVVRSAVSENLTDYLASITFVRVDIDSLITNAPSAHEAEKDLISLLEEASTSPRQLILFIDDFSFMASTRAGLQDIWLGKLQIIAGTAGNSVHELTSPHRPTQ